MPVKYTPSWNCDVCREETNSRGVMEGSGRWCPPDWHTNQDEKTFVCTKCAEMPFAQVASLIGFKRGTYCGAGQ